MPVCLSWRSSFLTDDEELEECEEDRDEHDCEEHYGDCEGISDIQRIIRDELPWNERDDEVGAVEDQETYDVVRMFVSFECLLYLHVELELRWDEVLRAQHPPVDALEAPEP